jgi:hypothetical protein
MSGHGEVNEREVDVCERRVYREAVDMCHTTVLPVVSSAWQTGCIWGVKVGDID